MHFEKGHIYHVYNQGNNRQKIFFSKKNYNYFLNKMEMHITPYADIIAWCLMPNHFHIMIYIINPEIPNPTNKHKQISLNHSLGIMLSSYTRAINRQNNTSGSLFRNKTKAICITESKNITASFYNTVFGMVIEDRNYLTTCFNYIHNNPVNAGLATKKEDWEFSSYKDYINQNHNSLVSLERGNDFFKLD